MNNAVSSSPNASPENLEDNMWRLKIEGNNEEGMDSNQNQYPDRPGAADCIYYLRTGLCGYGSNCRYNHPTYNGLGNQERDELPERVGQPDCQYFLKTGTCKFGATCKYHHPRDRHDARPVTLNNLGLPMRQDEKSCPYYMRTGTCKFGTACKFNHPPTATLGAAYPMPTAYESTGSSLVPPSSLPLVGGFSPWPVARNPYVSGSRMQGVPAYMPVILPPSQGTMPMQQGWSTYTGSINHLASTDILGSMQVPNAKLHSQSGSSTIANLPERPEQPECQYYMKTGNCKFGTTCKYHHPKERYTDSPYTLGPMGLPLRPGHPVCTFYSMYGSCRFGSACKYDHPLMGYYNYSVPTLSVVDPQVAFPSNPNHNNNSPSTTEASLSRPLKSQDQVKKSGGTNNIEANTDTANNSEHIDNPSISPSTHTSAPSSDTQQNHSD